MASGRIFISYRRGADNDSAGRLYDRLQQALPQDQIFRDVDSAADLMGLDFQQVLTDQVQNCAAQIAVIGPGWLADMPRLQNPDDFVRIELEAGLARPELRVIPVLVSGADIPKTEDLPDSLHELCRRGGIKLSNEGYTDGIDTIVRVLNQALEAQRADDTDIPTPEDKTEPQAQIASDETEGEDTPPDPDPTPAEPVAPVKTHIAVTWLSYAAYAFLAALALGWALSASALQSNAERLLSTALSMSNPEPVELTRASPGSTEKYMSQPDASVADTLDSLAIALEEDVKAGHFEILSLSNAVTLRLPLSLLFAAANDDLLPEAVPVLQRIAQQMDADDGAIDVAVHSDDSPVMTAQFKSNSHLTLARASAVARELAKSLKDPTRLFLQGRGDSEPIAGNQTDADRALNRRLELSWRPER